MRWAVLIGGVVALCGGVLAGAGLTPAADMKVAGTEWGSDPPCQMEVVRFHEDGTAHVIYDSVYDFVDADEATWSQHGGVVTLKVNDEEYQGHIKGEALRMAKVSAPAGRSHVKSCAFAHATWSRSG